MPKSKKGKKKKKAEPEEDDGVLTKKKLDEMKDRALVKEVYAQTRELERCENLGKDNEALKKVATHLRTRLDQHLAKQATVIHLLNEKIFIQNEKIMELSTKAANLQEENENIASDHEKNQRDTTADHYQKVAELEAEMKALEDINAQLTHFHTNKTTFMDRLAEYQAALDAEKAAHQYNVDKLDERNVEEKERLKQEMLRKIKETKLSLLAMTEDQLHSTTKRTIMENEQMTTELHYQLREVDRLKRSNIKLERENTIIRKKMSQHASQQNMLATRTRFFQKLIDKLKAQLEEQNRMRAQEKTSKRALQLSHKKNGQNKQLKLEENDRKIRLLEDKIEDLNRMSLEAKHTTECISAELEASRQAAHNMLDLQDEAITFLLMAIDDAKTRKVENQEKSLKGPTFGAHIRMTNIATDTPSDQIDYQQAKQVFQMPRHIKEMTLDHRELFLRMLLFKLNTVTSYSEVLGHSHKRRLKSS